jgi:hypothetical protein
VTGAGLDVHQRTTVEEAITSGTAFVPLGNRKSLVNSAILVGSEKSIDLIFAAFAVVESSRGTGATPAVSHVCFGISASCSTTTLHAPHTEVVPTNVGTAEPIVIPSPAS